jgi:protein TonB
MNLDVVIPSIGVVLGIAGLFVTVLALVFFIRMRYNSKTSEDLAAGLDQNNPTVGRTKYPGVDVFRLSNSFFAFGLVLSLLTCIFAFNWTTYDDIIFIPDDALELEDDIEVEPPRTAEPPPPPPPPPPPVIEEVPEELIEEEDEPEFIDQSIEAEEVVEAPVVEVKDVPPPPPPPPPPAPKVEEIFKVVEQMPMFPGCENAGGSNEEMQQCATKKMLEFIYGHIKYPAIARENGVEGTAVVTFVVEKDGSITGARVVRDPGAQTGDEALRVVKTFPQWAPGKQRGQPVRVQFNLPVKFRLE